MSLGHFRLPTHNSSLSLTKTPQDAGVMIAFQAEGVIKIFLLV
jgi:hypothetical protein